MPCASAVLVCKFHQGTCAAAQKGPDRLGVVVTSDDASYETYDGEREYGEEVEEDRDDDEGATCWCPVS